MLHKYRPDSLIAAARESCIFPMVPKIEMDRLEPTIFVSGEGCTLTDIHGEKVLDAMSSHTRANSLGYGNREVAEAMYDQAVRLHYIGSQYYLAPPTIELAARVAAKAPEGLDRVLFFSGGSESVEAALKLAKQYVQANGKPRAYKTISRWNAYHGSTMGALSVTDWLPVRDVSDPRLPGHSFIPNPMRYRNPLGMEVEPYIRMCARYLERQIQLEGAENVAAFIAEPVQQANGVQMANAGYWETIRETCDRHGVVLIIDEVICGFGRTGKWFASEHFGIRPDILIAAKAISGGYAPLGALIARADLVDRTPYYRHIQTFSGHATACAGALKVIEILERDGLIDLALANGQHIQAALHEALSQSPIVGEVRGLGHWHAIDLVADRETRAPFTDDTARRIVAEVRRQGVMVSAIGTAIEFAPPLIATRDELDRIVATCADSIARIVAEGAR